MTLRIVTATPEGVSTKTHPALFLAVREIGDEFPNGWYAHLVPGDAEGIEVELTAYARFRLPAKGQTEAAVQKALRTMYDTLIKRG